MRIVRFLFLAIFSFAVMAEEKEPSFSMTYNIGETLGFMAAKSLLVSEDKKLTYWPFHFDAQIRFEHWTMSLGLVYRYESYEKLGPTNPDKIKDKLLRSSEIWNNYHEIFLLAGPEFALGRERLKGFYASIRGGFGLAISPKYHNLSILAQPEVGYSFMLGTPGLSLRLGLGVLLNLPFYESIDFVVPWSKGYQKMGAMGVLVHQAIPVINLGLGFNL